MTRPTAWRTPALLVALMVAATMLGLPDRPTLTIGEVNAPVLTAFLVDGLRLLVTVAVWYLLLAVALTALDRLPGLRSLIRPVTDRLVAVGVAAALRRVLATSAALGVSLPSAAGAQGSTADPADEVPVMVPVPPGGREAAELPPPAPIEPEQLDADPPVMTRQAEPQPQTRVIDLPGPRPAAPATSQTHTVRPGESFWSIAEDLAERRAGSDPADLDDVVVTWQRLVDANADRLIDPGNPDLLHVGQVIALS